MTSLKFDSHVMTGDYDVTCRQAVIFDFAQISRANTIAIFLKS